MGSCERLCQESNTTCAIARTHGGGVGWGLQNERLHSNKLFSRGKNSLSQQPERLYPRHDTFGTFGLEDRSLRHHLLSVLWDHASIVEKAFAHFSEQPLPTFFFASSTQHPSLCIQALCPQHRMLIQEADTVMVEWDAIFRQERTLVTGTFSPAFRSCIIHAC